MSAQIDIDIHIICLNRYDEKYRTSSSLHNTRSAALAGYPAHLPEPSFLPFFTSYVVTQYVV